MKMQPIGSGDFLTPVLPVDAGFGALSEAPGGAVMLDDGTLADNGIVGFDPLDARSRSFVMLRSQLLNHFHQGGGRVLAIASAQPGNGKTFVTANIAAAMSLVHPTVLVDLDLRRPALAQRFGLCPDPGIDDYLTGEATLAQTGIRITESQLVIHGGRIARPDSATLLSGERMDAMLLRVRHRADAPICIVDTPPIMVLDDFMRISRGVDGVLLIVEEGSTHAGEIVEALRIIAPTPIVGTVLNKSLGADRSRPGYDAYYR